MKAVDLAFHNDDTRDLLRKVKNGNPRAKDEVFNRYFGIVKKAASELKGGTFEERLQNGSIGLLNAIENCDLDEERENFDATFGGYAKKYVRGYILQAIRSDRAVSLSKRDSQAVAVIHRVVSDLEEEGITPSVEEVVDRTDLPLDKVLALWDYDQVVHLDFVTPEGSSIGEQTASQDDDLGDAEQSLFLRQLISTLSPRKQEIMLLVLDGLKDPEIAERAGISVQRVRDIKHESIKQLRNVVDEGGPS